MTLHDYQLISPNYNLFANGKIWEASKPDKYWRCVADRCVKNSYIKSLVCALEAYWYGFLKIYEKIDLFISPSKFLINKFKEFGFKKEIVYLPNPLFAGKEKLSNKTDESYILYYGRLSAEKGIGDLLSAYSKLDIKIKLKIAGDGPLRKDLEEKIKEENIIGAEFLGHLDEEELQKAIIRAELIVAPSRWYENAPYSVLESLALGKIVLASDLGGLPELIKDGRNGFLFPAGKVEDLLVKMKYIINHPELKEKIAPIAVASVSVNSPKEYYENLIKNV
jgi:glycosyltransferase involved in cell wall biosynthesis